MLDFLPFPNINGESNEKKFAQINNYLIQFKEAIEFALRSMSSENKAVAEMLTKGLVESNMEREDQITQVSSKISSDSDVTMSTITQVADEIRTEVRTEYELKTDAREMYQELSSSITQTKDEISLSVSNKISESKIDGRNYVLKSEEAKTGTTQVFYHISEFCKQLNGQNTVLSFDARGRNLSEIVIDIGSTEVTRIDASSLTTSFTRFTVALPVIEDFSETLSIKGGYFPTTQFYTQKVKLEIGEVATDWTPAPEDLPDKFSQYSTTTEMQSAIDMKADEINIKVSKKVGEEEIVSKINQTAEEVKIDASKISLEGLVTVNEKFQILEDGSAKMTGADVSGHIRADSVNFHNNTDNIESTFVVQPAYVDISVCDNNYANPTLYTSSVVVGANGLLYLIGRNIEIFEHAMTTWDGNVKFLDTVYNNGGGVAFTSDRNEKHSIEDLDTSATEQFIYSLKPRKFKYNSGTSDRFHHGLIAQEVKESMGEEDWGLYVKQVDEDGAEHLALRYDELIADLIATVQAQNERIKALEEKI